MFGMVAATGVRILAGVDYRTNRNNAYVVAISIGFGMIPVVAPDFFKSMPKELGPRAIAYDVFLSGRGCGLA
jgi:uric acid transporter